MKLRQKLLAEQQQLLNQRQDLLKIETKFTRKHCQTCNKVNSTSPSTACNGCPIYTELRQIGDSLMANLNELRGVRYDLQSKAPSLAQKSIQLEKEKNQQIFTRKIEEVKKQIQEREKMPEVKEVTEQPKSANNNTLTVELYKDFKAQGLSDVAIAKKFGLDNNKMYRFKVENGLIRSKSTKKERPVKKATQGKKDTTIKAEKPQDNSRLKELEEKLEHATKYIEQLISQNERLNQELWGSRINHLYAKQQEIESLVEKTQNIKIVDYRDEQLLGLISEIIETANSHEGFKYWKCEKKSDRDMILEEAADILHMLLSIGLVMNERITSIVVIKKDTITKQFLELVKTTLSIEKDKAIYQESFNLYIGLVEMLGFTWNDIENAYFQKHSKNINRQQNGY